jgi:hypothetical protein
MPHEVLSLLTPESYTSVHYARYTARNMGKRRHMAETIIDCGKGTEERCMLVF